GGGSNIWLSDDGEKTPDFAIYEQPDIPDALTHYPMIAWEVGYSETAKKLGQDAARLVAGTFGGIQLVITVNIEDKIVKGIGRQLKAVTINFWEFTESEQLEYWAGKDSNLNCLMHV
ncbi:hypothetical protein L208DRAFT_1201745, partial [Tricholoma matsutake]